MRLTAAMNRWMLTCVVCLLGGCQNREQVLEPQPDNATFTGGIGGVEMKPEWKTFALDNYRGFVLADIPDVARSSAKFPEPQIIASPAGGSAVELMAVGVVNSRTYENHGVQRAYSVKWKKGFGGWSHVDTYVGDAKPYEPPIEKEPVVTVLPKTQPTSAPAP